MGWELFGRYVRALHEVKPKFFIYENNKSMSKAIRASIDEAFGFEAVGINSALVSAQNRQRLYWVGKREADGTYSKVNVEQPEDRGMLLRDILETGAHLSENDKSFAMIAEPLCAAERGRYLEDVSIEQHYEVRTDGKTNVLTTVQKDNWICEPVRVGTYPNNAKNQAQDSQQYRIYSTEGKGVTLCGNGGGMGAKTGLHAVPECPAMRVRKATKSSHPIYEVRDGLITIKGKQYPIKLVDGFYIIRKLTVRECMRLQTVPEWYEFPVSDTQAYKMLGNGWTVEVIAWLLNAIVKEEQDEKQAD